LSFILKKRGSDQMVLNFVEIKENIWLDGDIIKKNHAIKDQLVSLTFIVFFLCLK
jgi:hypothetical protein